MKTITQAPLTALASDPLTAQDSCEIYDELRGYDGQADTYAVSLDAFLSVVGTPPSKAMWSKYHRRKLTDLTATMRNRLRVAIGREPLPPSVAEALADVAEDGTVYQVGDQPPDSAVKFNGVETPTGTIGIKPPP